MSNVFDILNYSQNWEKGIQNFVTIESKQFKSYHYEVCGLGLNENDIITTNNEEVFSTKYEQFSIEFHFKHIKINPISIHLESQKEEPTCTWGYPTKFALKGSNTGTDWEEIESFENESLSTRGKLVEFPIVQTETNQNNYFSYFQLNVFECSSSGSNWKAISRFTINGSIIRNSNETCIRKNHINSMILFYIAIFI